tara:strand:+ start:50338 stop:50508 length:171 start_codon:yes stop_codon:yes gene_type:complete
MSQQEVKDKAIEANTLPFDRNYFPIDQVQAHSKQQVQIVRAMWTNIARTQQSNWRS